MKGAASEIPLVREGRTFELPARARRTRDVTLFASHVMP